MQLALKDLLHRSHLVPAVFDKQYRFETITFPRWFVNATTGHDQWS